MSAAFEEACPFYLSLGMAWELFWDGDSAAVRAYRAKARQDAERDNRRAWMAGMYVYEAVGDLAPILQAFAKKGSKPRPYAKRPHAVTEEAVRREREIAAREEREEALARTRAWMERVNAGKGDGA